LGQSTFSGEHATIQIWKEKGRGVCGLLARMSTAVCTLGCPAGICLFVGTPALFCLSTSLFVRLSPHARQRHPTFTTQRALTEWRRSLFLAPPPQTLAITIMYLPTYLPIWPNSLTSFPLLFAFLLCHTSLGRFYIQSQHACITRGLLESPRRFGGRLVSHFWARLILVIFTHTRTHNNTTPRAAMAVYTTFQGVAGWRQKLLYTLGSVNLFIHVRIVFLVKVSRQSGHMTPTVERLCS